MSEDGKTVPDPVVTPPAPEPPGTPPPEVTPPAKPDTVSGEDFRKLQSTYDTKITSLTEALKTEKQTATDLKTQLEQAKTGLPEDAAERLKLEAKLKQDQAALGNQTAEIDKRALNVRARELMIEHLKEIQERKLDVTVDKLVGLGSETDMELHILREVTKPVSQANLPNVQDVPNTPGQGPVQSTGLQAAIDKAKGK